MPSIVRWVLRRLGVFVAAALAFGLGSALVAVLARRRVVNKGGASSASVALAAIFDGAELQSEASAFRGGSLLAWYGGMTLDLRRATLDPAGATIDARAVFGGVGVLVPPGWRVEAHGWGLFGGFGSGVDAAGLPEDAPTIRMRGFSIFGGVWASSVPADAPADVGGAALAPTPGTLEVEPAWGAAVHLARGAGDGGPTLRP